MSNRTKGLKQVFKVKGERCSCLFPLNSMKKNPLTFTQDIGVAESRLNL